jgi:hypothetical protein
MSTSCDLEPNRFCSILFGYILGEYSFESHESFPLVLFIAIYDLNPCDSSYKGGKFLFDFMPGISWVDGSIMSFSMSLSPPNFSWPIQGSNVECDD